METFPDEILCTVFSFIDQPTDLGSILLVCKRWRDLALHPRSFRIRCQRRCSQLESLPEFWTSWADLDRYMDVHHKHLEANHRIYPNCFMDRMGHFTFSQVQSGALFHFIFETAFRESETIAPIAWEILIRIPTELLLGSFQLDIPATVHGPEMKMGDRFLQGLFWRLGLPPVDTKEKKNPEDEADYIGNTITGFVDIFWRESLDDFLFNPLVAKLVPLWQRHFDSDDPNKLRAATRLLGAVSENHEDIVHPLFDASFERLVAILGGQIPGLPVDVRTVAAWTLTRYVEHLADSDSKGPDQPRLPRVMQGLVGLMNAKGASKEEREDALLILSELIGDCGAFDVSHVMSLLIQPTQACMHSAQEIWERIKEHPKEAPTLYQEELRTQIDFFEMISRNECLLPLLTPHRENILQLLKEGLQHAHFPALACSAEYLGTFVSSGVYGETRTPEMEAVILLMREQFPRALEHAKQHPRKTKGNPHHGEGEEEEEEKSDSEEEEDTEMDVDDPVTSPVAIVFSLADCLDTPLFKDNTAPDPESFLRALEIPSLCASLAPHLGTPLGKELSAPLFSLLCAAVSVSSSFGQELLSSPMLQPLFTIPPSIKLYSPIGVNNYLGLIQTLIARAPEWIRARLSRECVRAVRKLKQYEDFEQRAKAIVRFMKR